MEGYTPEDRELLREMWRVRRSQKGKRLLWSLIVWGILAVAAGWFAFSRYFVLAVAQGPAMGDALPGGSVVLFQKYQDGETPQRGDVILFGRERGWEIKRVAAVGGDEIDQEENGQLTVNGAAIAGCLTGWAEETPERPFTVAEGELFVLGDRYALSVDSRDAEFGSVELDSVVGAAKYLIWPAYRIGEVN